MVIGGRRRRQTNPGGCRQRTHARHTFLLLSDPSNPGKFANALTYACQLDEAGHEVAVYFDGAATD